MDRASSSAGKAFASEPLRRGDASGLAKAREQLRAFADSLRDQAFQDSLREATAELDATLRAVGMRTPGDSLDAWIHLAKVVEKDPEGMSLQDIYEWAMAWNEREDIRAAKFASAIGADSADKRKIFPDGVPDDTEVVDVVILILNEKERGKSLNQIAREYTGETVGNFPKAARILDRIRKGKARGKIVL